MRKNLPTISTEPQGDGPECLLDILTAAGATIEDSYECPCCHQRLPAFALFRLAPDELVTCGQCMLDAERPGIAAAEQAAGPFGWDDFRAMRSQKLAECDWTQLVDVPPETRDAWQPYRDALRDAPADAQAQLDAGTIASLTDFEWPVVPAPPAGDEQ